MPQIAKKPEMACIGPAKRGKVLSNKVPSANCVVLNTGKKLNRVNPIDTINQIIFPFVAYFIKKKYIMAPINNGKMEDMVTARANPGGTVAPSALATKVHMLLSPAPIRPAIAPPLRALKNVMFCVSMVS